MTKQEQYAAWVQSKCTELNPYKTTNQSSRNYDLYNVGFLAAYLANLMTRDPYIQREFERHVHNQKQQKKQPIK